MKVQILRDGKYSDFEVAGRPHKVGAKMLAVGDEVNYPDWYAESIIESGLAEAYIEPDFIEARHTKLINATSAAFRLAGELDVDLLTLTGSGARGRITAGDVRKATQ